MKDIVEEVNYDGIKDIKHMFGREQAEQAERKGTEEVKNLFRKDDDEGPELIEDGDRVKTWRFGRSFNSSLTGAVMVAITHHVDMPVVVVYSFSCDIYQGGGAVNKYHKSKSTEGSFSSLAEIEAFIEACEMQWLDVEDGEFWSKAYLPSERTIETPGAFKGKLIFDHVQIKIILTRELLLGCGLLPDWLRKKRCIYALDGTEKRVDNLCI